MASAHCPCSTCVLKEASKLEKKKLYKESFLVYKNGLKYYEKNLEEINDAIKKFEARMQSSGINVQINATEKKPDSNPLPRHVAHREWPIAIFDNDNDPNLKRMYPKQLVYRDGKDYQLEEVLAERYWREQSEKAGIGSTNQVNRNVAGIGSTNRVNADDQNIEQAIGLNPSKTDLIQTLDSVSNENAKEVQSSKSVTSKGNKTVVSEPLDTIVAEADLKSSVCPIVSVPEKHADSKSANMYVQESFVVSNITDSMRVLVVANKVIDLSEMVQPNLPNEILSKMSNLTIHPEASNVTYKVPEKITHEPEEKSTPASKDFAKNSNDSNKENVLQLNASDNDEEEYENEDTSCNTNAFCVPLPSSTPFQKNKNFNKTPISSKSIEPIANNENSSSERLSLISKSGLVASTLNHLSPIEELSKERYSHSQERKSQEDKNQEPTAQLNDKPMKPSVASGSEPTTEDTDPFYLKDVQNPFHKDVMDGILERMQFPNGDTKGYSKSNTGIPVVKSFTSLKLGREKYLVSTEIGKGSYARILKIQYESKTNNKILALKYQKPACLWEWYINKEISTRLKDKKQLQYFLQYSEIFIYQNGSILLSEWAPNGTILNFVNYFKTSTQPNGRCPMSVCAFLSLQLIAAIQYLHSCKIIHGDVKPDNFVLTKDLNTFDQCVKLIDYGRSIDMTLFPPQHTFTYVVETDDFVCNEMKEKKPWTYQTDLYGLAGTIYLLLMSEYMKTEKRDNKWILKKPLYRYLSPDNWLPIFDTLLNVPSCSNIPDLSSVRSRLQTFYDEIDKAVKTQEMSKTLTIIKRK